MKKDFMLSAIKQTILAGNGYKLYHKKAISISGSMNH